MSKSHFEINPGAIETILRGPDSIAQKKHQGERIRERWAANIHRITGATEASLVLETEGFDVYVTADEASGETNNPSAWYWLEYGNSKMRPQHPGRRAIRSS